MLNNISDIVTLKTFKPVIDFQVKNENEYTRLINDYIVTEELAENLERILESLTLTKSPTRREKEGDFGPALIMRSFLIQGSYGTGKSYFLLMLSAILESIKNGQVDRALEKFKGFDGVIYQIEQLQKKNIDYFVVKVNGIVQTRRDFEEALMYSFIDKCKNEFDDYDPHSAYDKAIEKLLQDRKNDNLWRIIEPELEKMGLRFDTLVSALKKYDAIALQQYKDLMNRAYGVDVNIYDADFPNFIRESTAFVHKKGYTGIAFIFDEYSAYLTARKEDGKINTNISQSQQLAEATELSANNNILFVASTHKALRGILASSTVEKEDIDKIVERFYEIPLQYESGGQLIENVLRIDDKNYVKMLSIYPKAVKHAQSATNNQLKQFYPMHPQTVEYLMKLSQHFAQENRTVFKFMSDVVDKKIKKGKIVEDDVLNLVTPDTLYNYFIDGVGESNVEIIKSSQIIFEHCETEWQRRIVKLLIVARMSIFIRNADTSTRYGLSADEIADFLLIEDKEEVKAFLEDMSSRQAVNIYYDEVLDTYTFYESGSSKIDIDKLIEEEARRVNPYDVLKTEIFNNASIFIKKKHDVRNNIGVTPVERSLATEVYSIEQIEKRLKEQEEFKVDEDGMIVYIIPEFNELQRLDVNKLRRYMESYPDNIAIAVPKEGVFSFREETIARYRAMWILSSSPKLDEQSKIYLENEIRKEEKLLAAQIKEFDDIQKFTLIFSRKLVRDDFSNTKELYSTILKRYYYKFPEIESLKMEAVGKRNTTNPLIDNFIKDRTATIDNPPSKPFQRHIANTMKSLDLAQLQKKVGGIQTATLKIPEKANNSASAEIFDIIISPDITVEEKFELLEKAPYGLPDYMVELYISAAISLGKVRLLKDNSPVPNSSKNITDIIRGGYELESYEVNYTLEDLKNIEQLWEIIGRAVGNADFKSFDPLSGSVNEEINSHYINLRMDINRLIQDMEGNILYMKRDELQTAEFEKLANNLKVVHDELRLEKFIPLFIDMPLNVFDTKNIQEGVEEFRRLMNNYKKIKANRKDINNVLIQYNRLKEEKKRFQGFSEMEQAFKKIERIREKFLRPPYDMDLLDEMQKEIDGFILLFNKVYVEKHANMYRHFYSQKNIANNMGENAIIEKLEEINFAKADISDIRKLREINYKLATEYKNCTEDLPVNSNKELLACSCMRNDASLDAFSRRTKEFNRELQTAVNTVSGLMDTYAKAFIELEQKARKNGKETLNEYISDEDPTLAGSYISFMQRLNDNPIAYKEELLVDIEKLTGIINEYIKYLSIEVSETKGDSETISILDLNNKITANIKYTGKAMITPKEYIEKIQETVISLGEIMIKIE